MGSHGRSGEPFFIGTKIARRWFHRRVFYGLRCTAMPPLGAQGEVVCEAYRRGSELAMTASLQPLSLASRASSPSQGSLWCVGVDALIDPCRASGQRPAGGCGHPPLRVWWNKKTPLSLKRQRRTPLRYHSRCQTAACRRITAPPVPVYCPKGFGGRLGGDLFQGDAACLHQAQAL